MVCNEAPLAISASRLQTSIHQLALLNLRFFAPHEDPMVGPFRCPRPIDDWVIDD